MSEIKIIKEDITNMDVECVVNAANEYLRAGSGVCGAIFEKAGIDELTKECMQIGHCPTGGAAITHGFSLKAKYIIHAVGPVWYGGVEREDEKLYSCYLSALQLAQKAKIHSIAFPLISTGVFGYPKKEAWHTAIKACIDFIKENKDYDIKIVFAVINDELLKMGEEELKLSDVDVR